MIGGIDIRITTKASIEVATCAIKQHWINAVIEHVDAAELFVYRDSEAEKLWNKHGAIPATENSMIHLLHDDSLITVVIDDRTDEMEMIVQSIKSALNQKDTNEPS